MGNVGRHRRWPWAILFVLFALTFAWSFASWGIRPAALEHPPDRVGGWSGHRSVASRPHVHLFPTPSAGGARGRFGTGADGNSRGSSRPPLPPMKRSSARARSRRGTSSDAPGDEERTGDEDAQLEAEAQGWAEQQPAEEHAPTSEEDGQALEADLDEADDRVEALEADGDPQDNLRRMREEFKARAEEAALRVKQREAELHEAASASGSEAIGERGMRDSVATDRERRSDGRQPTKCFGGSDVQICCRS